ncbi:MAG TPA: hypothetical protein VNA68_01775 [Candidatus Dormibacteraeota bacterium]|nr:hypothetical protein [Candidatus Dormibacteraeota bacterium]
MWRNWPCGLMVVLLMVLILGTTVPAQAAGGDSIATAPAVQYGELTTGGGKKKEFWRLPVYAGDMVTFRWSGNGSGEDPDRSQPVVSFYDPAIDDYKFNMAIGQGRQETGGGKSEFTFTPPSTGLWSMHAANESKSPEDLMWPFSFIATVEHSTAITFISYPRRVSSPRSKISLTARVQSPAGNPTGMCAFDKIGGIVRQFAEVPVQGGYCKATFPVKAKRSVRYRVRYLPDNGWLADTDTTKAIKIGSGKKKRK